MEVEEGQRGLNPFPQNPLFQTKNGPGINRDRFERNSVLQAAIVSCNRNQERVHRSKERVLARSKMPCVHGDEQGIHQSDACHRNLQEQHRSKVRVRVLARSKEQVLARSKMPCVHGDEQGIHQSDACHRNPQELHRSKVRVPVLARSKMQVLARSTMQHHCNDCEG